MVTQILLKGNFNKKEQIPTIGYLSFFCFYIGNSQMRIGIFFILSQCLFIKYRYVLTSVGR